MQPGSLLAACLYVHYVLPAQVSSSPKTHHDRLPSAATTPPLLPQWQLPEPNTSLPLAGLQLLNRTKHSVVYQSHSTACNPPRQDEDCLGTYNHAPLIVRLPSAGGPLIVGWHNEQYDEDSGGGRALFSTSTDGGAHWRPAAVLFGNLSSRRASRKDDEQQQRAQPPPQPFCVLDTASNKYYIKAGGDPSKRSALLLCFLSLCGCVQMPCVHSLACD